MVYIVLFDISDCAWMGTINKWLHGVVGHMDVPPPLRSTNFFTALMEQNIVFFQFYCDYAWKCISDY